jgi:hypothetical protein
MQAVMIRETGGVRPRTALCEEKALLAELKRMASVGIYWIPLDMQEEKCVSLIGALKRLNGME